MIEPRERRDAPAARGARRAWIAGIAMLGVLGVVGVPRQPHTPPPVPDSTATPTTGSRLVARHGSLAELYRTWEAGYRARGGDRAIVLRLGRALALHGAPAIPADAPPIDALPAPDAAGRLRLDLPAGTAEVSVTGLTGAVDLWLVDNRPGDPRGALPGPGDEVLYLARLSPDASGAAHRRLRWPSDRTTRFEPDLAVVTVAGRQPHESPLLWGARTYFERLHTRLERERLIPLDVPAPLDVLPPLDVLTPRPAHAGTSAVLVARELVSRQVADGADLFFRQTFRGNGRTCSTCHRAKADLQVDAPLIATLPPDDPLFVAEFDRQGVPGLEVTELLRGFGLVLANIDGFEAPTEKFTLRGVPHILSMATSVAAPADDARPAVERTGWSGDGAPLSGALRFFAVGAIIQHLPRNLERVEGRDFRLPTDDELDALEAYMLTVGRLRDTPITGMQMTDPRAEAGREAFLAQGKCFVCHSNAGAISGFGGNRNFETGIAHLPLLARTLVDFPDDGGFGRAPLDRDGDGTPDAFGDGTFNTPPLVEAADTGPFFHNNAIDTLEEAVAFYDGPEFNASPGAEFVEGIELTAEEIDQIAAFLRVLNAAYNLDLARQRLTAATLLGDPGLEAVRLSRMDTDDSGPRGMRGVADGLVELAQVEMEDAVRVLAGGGLHPRAVGRLEAAGALLDQSLEASRPQQRVALLRQAEITLGDVQRDLGRNLVFVLGEGNLLF